MSQAPVELLLDRGIVLTMTAARPVLERGWVGMSEGRIVGVGSGDPPPAGEVVDCSGDVILPGFVNAHAHLLGAFVRGMGGDRATTLGAGGNRPTVAVRLAMQEEDAYAAARLAIVEMQLSGVTATTDSQPAMRGLEFQADGTLRALLESGMHAVFYRASVDRTDFFPAPTYDTTDLASAEISRLVAGHRTDRIAIGIEPMALHRVTDGLLADLIGLARQHRLPIGIHGPYAQAVAEHPRERWGRSTIGVLSEFEALGPDLLVHHPVVLDATEISQLADTDTATSVCTVDNMLIGTGPAPLARLLEAGIRTGIGLDQPNDGHDMFQLMKITMLAQRLDGAQWGAPEAMIELATSGGASALALQTGTIEPGGWADLIVLDGAHPTLQPRHTVISNLVLSAGPQAIKSVYTKGIKTVDRGRHLTWDQDEVIDSAALAMKRCLERAGLSSELWTGW